MHRLRRFMVYFSVIMDFGMIRHNLINIVYNFTDQSRLKISLGGEIIQSTNGMHFEDILSGIKKDVGTFNSSFQASLKELLPSIAVDVACSNNLDLYLSVPENCTLDVLCKRSGPLATILKNMLAHSGCLSTITLIKFEVVVQVEKHCRSYIPMLPSQGNATMSHLMQNLYIWNGC